MAGAAVVVSGVYGGKGDKADEWEAVARRSTDEAGLRFNELFPASVRLSDGPIDEVTRAAKTDANGNFRLTGFGRDRLLGLRVSGPGIATTDVKVVTRDMKAIVTPGDKLPSQHAAQTYYGATFELAVEPSQPFRGRVTDRATGRPVAGVVVRRTGWSHPAEATTGADGRYALDGLPPGEHELLFVPPIESPYFIRKVTAGRAANLRPVTADAELYAGVWVTGTVRDAKTGRPVEVPLVYRPHGDNTAAEQIPGYVARGLYEFGRYASGPDGRFKALALPGKGFLLVQTGTDGYMKADYADWQGDVAKPDPEQFVPSSPVEIASNQTAVCAVTVAGDKPAKEYHIKLDPGEIIGCRVTDPDGKPLPGAFAGPRESWSVWTDKPLSGAEFDFKNVNPNRPRPVYVFHPGKKLGTTFTPGKGATGPLEIRLKPVGTATGRLLDDEGRPLANVLVEVGGSHSYADLSVGMRYLHPAVTTDAAGRFTVPNLVEGMTYHLRWRGTSPKGGAESRYHKFGVTGGETKDLGDVGRKMDDD